MNERVPEYVRRRRAAAELCMSDDTFDKYVRAGILPSPKRRGKLTRWKWLEIVAVLDGGATGVVTIARDAFEQGAERAKEAHP